MSAQSGSWKEFNGEPICRGLLSAKGITEGWWGTRAPVTQRRCYQPWIFKDESSSVGGRNHGRGAIQQVQKDMAPAHISVHQGGNRRRDSLNTLSSFLWSLVDAFHWLNPTSNDRKTNRAIQAFREIHKGSRERWRTISAQLYWPSLCHCEASDSCHFYGLKPYGLQQFWYCHLNLLFTQSH